MAAIAMTMVTVVATGCSASAGEPSTASTGQGAGGASSASPRGGPATPPASAPVTPFASPTGSPLATGTPVPRAWAKPVTDVAAVWRSGGDSGWGGGLEDVVVTGPREAWAVGSHDEGEPSVKRWDGVRWRDAPAPGRASYLMALAAASPGEVWVFDHEAHAWRWTGSAWTSMGGQDRRRLGAAVAAAPGDVWVGGSTLDDDSTRAYLARWSGGHWSREWQPAGVSSIRAMSATGPRDVWAVGGASILHWDGQTWATSTFGDAAFPSLGVPGPQWPGDRPQLVLLDVDAVSPTEVWAVGTLQGTRRADAVALRYDGTRWTSVAVPARNDGPDRAYAASFSAVVADGHGGFWAATQPQVSILHYTGGRWTRDRMPDALPGAVTDLATVPGGAKLIAVGDQPDYDEDGVGWIAVRD
jgi:hypothetical protein